MTHPLLKLHPPRVTPDRGGIVLFVHGLDEARSDLEAMREVHVRGLRTVRVDALPGMSADDAGGTAELAELVVDAIDAIRRIPELRDLPLGLFGGGDAAAATLVAAALRADTVASVICREGRPDIAGSALARVRAPALFLVGSLDAARLALHREAAPRLATPPTLTIIAGARELFEDPAVVDDVARMTAEWFVSQFQLARESATDRTRAR